MEAMRQASAGDSPWAALVICILLGLGYAAVAAVLSGVVLRSARRHATLALT
jgi:ABC-2 type transport system permease protein